jgi:hypothetical protein
MLMLVVQEVLVNQSMCLERLKCSEDSVGPTTQDPCIALLKRSNMLSYPEEGQSASKAAVP